jgi:hypothetical protein
MWMSNTTGDKYPKELHSDDLALVMDCHVSVTPHLPTSSQVFLEHQFENNKLLIN